MKNLGDMQILTPTREQDKQLIELSYKSLFYKRKEFEYIRIPPLWFRRYELARDSIKKCISCDNKIIASLGLLIRNGVVNGKEVVIGCLVDNCIDPDYLEYYEFIFGKLFESIEFEAKNKNVDVIEGWDFQKNITKYKTFFLERGYTYVSGVNWFPGGSNPFNVYPSVLWKILLKIYYYYFKSFSFFLKSLPTDLNLQVMSKQDYVDVGEFLSKASINYQFGSIYKDNDFEKIVETNNLHGIIARKDGQIVGVLTYLISAWSGWMFGKPFYDKKYTPFMSYTPDEFHISPEYQESTIAAHMLLELMKTKNPHTNKHVGGDYLFNVDVFHNKISWRKKALTSIGYSEPSFDYGGILAKSLKNGISLDTTKPWLLPSRYILSPVDHKTFNNNTNLK